MVLRRFKWNSFNDEVGDWGGDQVDHGDGVRDVSVASGPGASCLEEAVEAFEASVGVPGAPTEEDAVKVLLECLQSLGDWFSRGALATNSLA